MEIIRHRRNTRAELLETPREYGIEVDIRSWGEQLVIHHDPFIEGEDFVEWLRGYEHGTLILNVKEEGLETRLLALMAEHGVTRFFFLDQSFPFLVKTAREGERRCAVRVSEYEDVATALSLAGHIDWVWVDCFTRFPLDRHSAWMLRDAGLRLCIVSPELQGRSDERALADFRRALTELRVEADAVCTKRPDLWVA